MCHVVTHGTSHEQINTRSKVPAMSVFPPTYSSSISCCSPRILLSRSSLMAERDHQRIVTKVRRARRVSTK